MDNLIQHVLEQTVSQNKAVFGDDCTFISFDKDIEHYFPTLKFSLREQYGRIRCFQDGEEKCLDDLVVRTTSRKQYDEAFYQSHVHEYTFYGKVCSRFGEFHDIGPLIGPLFPNYFAYFYRHNVQHQDAIALMENVESTGYFPPSKRSFLDFDHLSVVMRKIGQLHAFSYRDREVYHDYALPAMLKNKYHGPVLKRSDTTFLQRSVEPVWMNPAYIPAHDNVLSMINMYDEIVSDVYRLVITNGVAPVLCYNAFHKNGLYFKNDEGKPIDLKMTNVANWRFGSPALDISLLLYLKADQKMRDEHWNDLMNEYYEALQSTFPLTNVPSKEAILIEMKRVAIAAYFIACRYLPRSIALDNSDMPQQAQLVPQRYRYVQWNELPETLQFRLMKELGGWKATAALVHVLEDMINREYL